MPADFSELTDRHATNSMKWDVGDTELPMWVADMDFRTAPVVVDAIRRKVDAGIFGYTTVPPEFPAAAGEWWRRRHGYSIEDEWVIFSTGVVPALSSIVRSMTRPGENVLIQPPVYDIFTNSIVNNARTVLTNDLVREDDGYRIDFDDLEHKLADPATTLMILCNPHNPVGRVWARDELARIAELTARHGVLVVTDEVHCDLTRPGIGYTPFASVSSTAQSNSINCWAPSKAFNLAGLHTASIVVPSPEVRARVKRGLNTDEVAEPNAFAIEATVAAFTHGDTWLDELRDYLQQNRTLTEETIRTEIPALRVQPADATYLAWIDCSAITGDATSLVAHLRDTQGLVVSNGGNYGRPGAPFLRMNLACPRERLIDGLQRLRRGVGSFDVRPRTEVVAGI